MRNIYEDGDIIAKGTIRAGTFSGITRAHLTQENLAAFAIPFEAWRVWDAIQTNLPGTSAADDLGLYGGTFGSSQPLVRTYDVKAAGAQTLYARVQRALPPEYVAGGSVRLRLSAGMVTAVADTSCTVDAEAYKVGGDNTLGSDLVTTSATTMNSLTFGDKDFVITGTTLSPGDILDIRVAIAVNDAATATAVIAAIAKAALLCDIKG